MSTATRRQRYRTSNYQEDPGLGLTIDISSADPAVFDDPIKLLRWLAGENATESTEKQDSKVTEKRFEATGSDGNKEGGNKGIVPIPTDAPLEVKYLLRRKIRCVDFRRRGGALWVIGDDDIAPSIKKLMACGMTFRYKEDGAAATGYKPAWWTTSVTPDGIEKIFEDIDKTPETRAPEKTVERIEAKGRRPRKTAKQANSPQVMALIGILAGVSCDGRVNEEEARTVKAWLDNIDCSGDERLIAVKTLIERCLEDDVITREEEREMLELFNKITSLAQDAIFLPNSAKPTSLKEYISENLTCEKCGAAMKLVKTRKFFLGCTQCDETRLLTPDEINDYIEACDVTCPECEGAIHGAVSRYGIYVRCENKHNISLDAI